MQQIVGVKFRNAPKVYYFSPAAGEEYPRGSTVIVETAKGLESGTVVIPLKEVEDEKLTSALKPILRRATEKDLEKIRRGEERRPEAMKICRTQIEKHKLDMKLIDCEFTFDGTKVVFYFSAPTRVDFRDLVKDLAGEFHLRIELRQVGIRDETRILGGIAPCGRPCCCSCGMSDFKKVSIKMAKTQGLPLNPGKISGLCGRLMCCLEYENDYYAGVYKQMPKIGSEAVSPEGRGVVASVNMLTMQVKLKIETREGGLVYKDFPLSELQIKRGGHFEKDGVPVEELPEGEEAEGGGVEALSDATPADAAPAPSDGERQAGERKHRDRKNRRGRERDGNRRNGNGQNGRGGQDRQNGQNGDHGKFRRDGQDGGRERREKKPRPDNAPVGAKE